MPSKQKPSSRVVTGSNDSVATRQDPPRVLVILTGGTIDKEYDVVRERFSLSEGKSQVPLLLAAAFIGGVEFKELFALDSRDMKASHRAQIATMIEESGHERIVVVHGTSTLIETASALDEQFGKEKTIVLTGALKPARYDGIESSANLAAAICSARYREPGVFVAMHGIVEHPMVVAKDGRTGVFVLAPPSADG